MTDKEKEIVISSELKERMRQLGSRYPDFHSALIPALWMVQHEFGFISVKAMQEVAGVFNIHPAHVESVLSFYTMYFDKPVGKHLIQICRSISCMLRGSDELIQQVENYLGIKVNETTPDGMFTLLTVECLGACGGAPVIQFDYDYMEEMNWEKTKSLIDRFRPIRGSI